MWPCPNKTLFIKIDSGWIWPTDRGLLAPKKYDQPPRCLARAPHFPVILLPTPALKIPPLPPPINSHME